jgi:hypothetical protein
VRDEQRRLRRRLHVQQLAWFIFVRDAGTLDDRGLGRVFSDVRRRHSNALGDLRR